LRPPLCLQLSLLSSFCTLSTCLLLLLELSLVHPLSIPPGVDVGFQPSVCKA